MAEAQKNELQQFRQEKHVAGWMIFINHLTPKPVGVDIFKRFSLPLQFFPLRRYLFSAKGNGSTDNHQFLLP